MRIPLPTWLRVPVATLLITASTVVHVTPLLLVAVLKAAVPLRGWRRGGGASQAGIRSRRRRSAEIELADQR